MTPKQNQWTKNPFIAADNGSSVSSSFNINIGEKLKSWLMAIAFVTSIAGNGYLALQLSREQKQNTDEIATALRKDAVAIDIASNNFAFFKANDWVNLKVEVETTKQLIAAKCSK